MANIANDGTITIDWGLVEESVRENHPNAAYARLMLAIRDGTWKPM